MERENAFQVKEKNAGKGWGVRWHQKSLFRKVRLSAEKWARPGRKSTEDAVKPGRAGTGREGPAGQGGGLARVGGCRKCV